MDCGFLIRRVYHGYDVQGQGAYYLLMNPIATFKPACIEAADSYSMKIKVQTRSVLSTTSKQCFGLTSSVLSAISKQCFEQPVARFLVCSLIFVYSTPKISLISSTLRLLLFSCPSRTVLKSSFCTFLEFLDFFLYGSKGDEAIDIHLFGLAKAVTSTDSLHLDYWIPPEVTEDDGISSC
ncbi:Uncharacterised protein [Chlamydia trachomatis]|nr:Uncharacterised protein [Chlamydia trachomatis]